MNIFEIDAAILNGIADQLAKSHPELEIIIGVTRLTAKKDGREAFVILLNSKGPRLQYQTEFALFARDFEYCDPRLFDQLDDAINTVLSRVGMKS